jgi:hypothetical protein
VRTRSFQRWTEGEDAVLRRTDLTADEVFALLRGRSVAAIRARLYRLGIQWRGPQ